MLIAIGDCGYNKTSQCIHQHVVLLCTKLEVKYLIVFISSTYNVYTSQ